MATENASVSLSTRFTTAVTKAYNDIAPLVTVSEYERSLIANYYININDSLKNSKQGYNWRQVRMDELGLTVANLAKMGLDMAIPGTVSFIPFKVKDTGTIRLIPCIGLKGYEFLVKEYGLEPPDNLVIEIVYANDKFSVVKKDANHEYESYVFEVQNPFNRGEIVGAFAALEYKDKMKNKLLVMSLKEILSYRPERSDSTFWGSGENRKKMIEKTIGKQILRKVTLDPKKVNGIRDNLRYVESEELTGASLSAQEEIREKNGQGSYIDFDTIVDAECEVVEPVAGENEVVEPEDDVLNMNEQYKMEV